MWNSQRHNVFPHEVESAAQYVFFIKYHRHVISHDTEVNFMRKYAMLLTEFTNNTDNTNWIYQWHRQSTITWNFEMCHNMSGINNQ